MSTSKWRLAFVLISFFMTFAVGVNGAQAQGKAPVNSTPALSAAVAGLQAQVAGLTARVAKLEGQITAADLVGTYRVNRVQNELHGGTGSTEVSSYVARETVQLAGDGTLTYTSPGEDGNTLRLYTTPPSVAAFVGAGGGIGFGTWSYADGAVTVTLDGGQLVLDVAAAGKVLVGAGFNHSDGTDVLLVLSRL